MSKVFLKRGDIYTQTEGNFSVKDNLDDGIYQTHQNPITGEIFLEKIADTFNFGFKLYGIDEKLVNHVLNTYNKQDNKRNLGVLLNGAKGTGKTVTAKYLCNKLGLPVIICDKPYPGLALFLAGIDHDCIFFFDEFEKNFRITCGDDEECAGEDLLSIMDGVYNSDNCHIFIMTTNELKVNDNLLCRPSRIRYLKSFGDVIDRSILEEYVDDNLIKKEYREEVLDFIDTLTIATIDIVKSIVDEINLHDVHIEEFKQFFNVKEAKYKYYIRSWYFNSTPGEKLEVTKKDFLDRLQAPYTAELDWRPTYDNITLNRNIKKYKEGDVILNERFRIEKLDLKENYMFLKDVEYRDRFRHVYIENIDTTPSLYDSGVPGSALTYPYWDD